MHDMKKRQNSHQHVDIKAFREKLEKSRALKSFGQASRRDAEGRPILPGGNYKIHFVDEVSDERRQSLATTHVVESYKRYNATTCCQNCVIF